MSDLGYEVLYADNAYKAVQILRALKYDWPGYTVIMIVKDLSLLDAQTIIEVISNDKFVVYKGQHNLIMQTRPNRIL